MKSLNEQYKTLRIMEKILKDVGIRPKVELPVEEYNHLVDLARMKAKKIEERAVEYYKKNGVCKISIDARIARKKTWDDSSSTETLKYEIDPWWVENKDNSLGPSPFKLDVDMVSRIKKAAKSIATNVFYNEFGDRLGTMDQILKYKEETERIRNKYFIVTLTGWLAALVLCVIAVLK